MRAFEKEPNNPIRAPFSGMTFQAIMIWLTNNDVYPTGNDLVAHE